MYIHFFGGCITLDIVFTQEQKSLQIFILGLYHFSICIVAVLVMIL